MAEVKKDKNKTTKNVTKTQKPNTTKTKTGKKVAPAQNKSKNYKTAKPNTSKKTQTKKTGTSAKNNKPQVKKTEVKKQEVKKTEVKKQEIKKQEVKKQEIKKTEVEKKLPKVEKIEKTKEVKEVKVAPPVKERELTQEELLEKTLIFDGRENQNLAEVVEKLEEKNVVLEDKIIKRNKANKIIIIVLTVLIAIVIVATTWYVVKDEIVKRENNQTLNSNIYKKVSNNYKTIGEINKQEKKDEENKENAAEDLKEIAYSNIETITLAEFERKIFEKENMTVLISNATCYPCLEFEPIINEVYEERNATIYRINMSVLSKDEVTRFRTYYAFKQTPTLFVVKNGIATSESVGILAKEDLISWLDKNA